MAILMIVMCGSRVACCCGVCRMLACECNDGIHIPRFMIPFESFHTNRTPDNVTFICYPRMLFAQR
jgi:hypothetical protein